MLTFKTLDMVQVNDMAAMNPKKYLCVEINLYAAERSAAKMIFVVGGLDRRVMTVSADADDIGDVDEIGFLIF